jgi:hypothetical protein
MEVPKRYRLQEIYRRLTQVPAAGTFDEMRAQLADVINAVEDQLTGIPYDPANWRNDERIYPVYDDNVFDVAGHPRVTLLRAKKNLVYIGDNGSAEIRNASGDVAFRKPGRDGLGVWELD